MVPEILRSEVTNANGKTFEYAWESVFVLSLIYDYFGSIKYVPFVLFFYKKDIHKAFFFFFLEI